MRGFGVALVALLLSRGAAAQDYFEPWPADLQTEVTHLYRGFSGEFAIYVKDLSSGAKYTHNSATPMYIASGIKLAVMVELFRQVAAKQVTLDEELVYGPDDVRDGAPIIGHLRPGTPVSLRLLLDAMIHQSDNAATDMIMKRVGVPNVNKGLVEEGIFGFGPITTLLDVRKLVYKEVDPRVLSLSPAEITAVGLKRNLEQRANKLAEVLHEPPGTITVADVDRAFKSYYRTGYNSASLDAVGALLERIAKRKMVSELASRQMLDVLLRTETGAARLRAGLPVGVPLAHKTGTQYKRICDLGIFYMGEDRPVVMAVCVKGGQTRKKAEQLIAEVGRRAHWALLPPDRRHALPEITLPFGAENGAEEGELGELPVKESAPPPVKKPKKPRVRGAKGVAKGEAVRGKASLE